MADNMRDRLVWVELPATELDRARKFYETVLETSLIEDNQGSQTIQMIPSKNEAMCGHLYEGRPATAGDGPTPHFSVGGTLPDARDRVASAGGEVVSDIIPLPVGAFFYAKDTEGNSIAIFRYSD